MKGPEISIRPEIQAAMDRVADKARGRTRFEGQEPFDDELLVQGLFILGLENIALRAVAIAARETLLFRHEMGGYTPEDVRTVIHAIDRALGNEPTPFRRIGDNETPEGEQ